MSRRIVLATCILGVMGGAAGTALAAAPSSVVAHKPHQLCLVLTKTDNTTQDYCIDWGAAQQR